ncbi:hypothetical protein QBC35DRAFT_164878 [Podospora australis]|uniref:Uncharacterized protein n=1 Tax=Podospora australis TaxID=1536484 RepID=A0AAN6X3T6_9PEZI|nr:hypothetical protein QBC35DRAFT_164878 [Podospora australis]
MRRPRFRRAPSSTWTIQEDMVYEAPRSPTQSSLRERDTGFPEPFCGNRNTSLHHPDAKVGEDACITEDDVNVGRALIRHRMSFQVQRERSRSRAGSLGLYDRAFSAIPEEGTFSTLGRLALTSIRGAADPIRPPSRDGESITSSDNSGPNSPTQSHSSGSSSNKEDPRDAVRDPREGRRRRRKSSFMGRLLHR